MTTTAVENLTAIWDDDRDVPFFRRVRPAQHHPDSTRTAPRSSLTTEPPAPQRARPTQEQP